MKCLHPELGVCPSFCLKSDSWFILIKTLFLVWECLFDYRILNLLTMCKIPFLNKLFRSSENLKLILYAFVNKNIFAGSLDFYSKTAIQQRVPINFQFVSSIGCSSLFTVEKRNHRGVQNY